MSKRIADFDNSTETLTPEDSKKLISLVSIFPDINTSVIKKLFTTYNFDSEATAQAILDTSASSTPSKPNLSTSKSSPSQTKKQVIVIDDENPKSQKLDNPNKDTKVEPIPQKNNNFEKLTKEDLEVFQKFTTKSTPKGWVDEGTDHEIAKQLQSALDEERLTLKVKQSKEREEGAVLPLEHGVVLFKNCLSEDEQMGIYQQCLELGNDSYRNLILHKTQYLNATHPIGVLSYNWNGLGLATNNEKVRPPQDLLQFGSDMFKRVYKLSKTLTAFKIWDDQHSPEFKFPSSYNPNSLNGIMYSKNATLASHVDGPLGWVLSVSIGDSALFFYSLENGKERTEIKIDSGDVVIFNGQKLFHGIDKIYPNTAPKFWKEIKDKSGDRFNLQFRDPSYLRSRFPNLQ